MLMLRTLFSIRMSWQACIERINSSNNNTRRIELKPMTRLREITWDLGQAKKTSNFRMSS